MPVVTDDTALLSGDYWNGFEVTDAPIVVTFSFPTSAPSYDSSAPGFTASTVSSFQAFDADEQIQALAALNEWASASGLVFVEVAPGQGDINFQNVDLSTTAGYTGDAAGIGFYPFGDWTSYSYPSFSGDLTASGDVFMNTLDQDDDGTVNYGTLLHEIGHAIGLKHPTQVVDDTIAGVDHDEVLASDDDELTIMAETGDPTDDHLKALDKDAAAYLYGPAGTGGVYTASASGSNSVSNWSWDESTQTLTQTAVSVGETIHGTSVDDIIYGSSGDDSLFGLAGDNQLYGGDGDDKLYDGPGTNLLVGGPGDDSYYVTNSATQIVEDPDEGYDTVYARVSFTLPANVEALYLSGDDLTGKGNNQGDSIFGDGTYASTLIGGLGDDYIVGGAGNDTIEGGGGHDLMFGGGGDNTFVFKSASEATPGPTLTTIGDFISGQDKIDLSAIKTTGANAGQSLVYIGSSPFSDVAGQVNEIQLNGHTVLEGDLNGDGAADFQIAFYNTSGGSPVSIQASDLVLSAACYCAGTRISTERGDLPIEALSVGDIVVTDSGGRRPIVWIGHRRIDIARHPDPAQVTPIRVLAGAFGEGLPQRDLWLSPGHNVACEGVLIPISALLNGKSVAQIERRSVEYWHVELDAHDILLAEGLPAESYLDTGNRAAFANGAQHIEAHPDFRPKHWADTCRPLVQNGPPVERTKLQLLKRLAEQGCDVDCDAGACIVADGVLIEPTEITQRRLTFAVPFAGREIVLQSKTFVPAHTRVESSDFRGLGLCVARLQIDDRQIPLDCDFGWARGWNEAEFASGSFTHRWTSGAAALPAGARSVIVELAGEGYYWRESPQAVDALSA